MFQEEEEEEEEEEEGNGCSSQGLSLSLNYQRQIQWPYKSIHRNIENNKMSNTTGFEKAKKLDL